MTYFVFCFVILAFYSTFIRLAQMFLLVLLNSIPLFLLLYFATPTLTVTININRSYSYCIPSLFLLQLSTMLLLQNLTQFIVPLLLLLLQLLTTPMSIYSLLWLLSIVLFLFIVIPTTAHTTISVFGYIYIYIYLFIRRLNPIHWIKSMSPMDQIDWK